MAKNSYINNKKFYDAMVKYNKDKKEIDNLPVPNYIGECIILIAERLGTKSNFSGYSYLDEMKADGIENALAAVPYFDVERTQNPFAYFTRIIWFAFLRRIEKEKRQHYLKLKNYQKNIVQEELTNDIPTLYNPSLTSNNDVIDSYIEEYEKKLNSKKKKSTKKQKKKGVEIYYDE